MKRHKTSAGCWYEYLGMAIYPFERSRMNRKTLGCYGHSARTKPTVTVRLWGVCNIADGVPLNYLSGSFTAPLSPIDAFDTIETAKLSLQSRYSVSLAGRDSTCAPLYEARGA